MELRHPDDLWELRRLPDDSGILCGLRQRRRHWLQHVVGRMKGGRREGERERERGGEGVREQMRDPDTRPLHHPRQREPPPPHLPHPHPRATASLDPRLLRFPFHLSSRDRVADHVARPSRPDGQDIYSGLNGQILLPLLPPLSLSLSPSLLPLPRTPAASRVGADSSRGDLCTKRTRVRCRKGGRHKQTSGRTDCLLLIP